MRLTRGAFPIHIRSLNHDRRKFEVKLPTIWESEASEVGRAREEKGRRKIREEKVLRERVRRKKSQAREKVEQGPRKGRKVWKDCVFHCLVVPAGRKVGSLKWRARSHVVG